MSLEQREGLRWMLALNPEEEGLPQPHLNKGDTLLAVTAAFAVATERALGKAPAIGSIRELISSIRGTYVNDETLQSAKALALIRGIYGEEELIRGIPMVEALRIELSVCFGIIQKLSVASGPQFEAYLDESARLADDLSADD